MNIAVVIPCYRVKNHILSVVNRIGPEVRWILCVDDACPEQTGMWLKEQVQDPRLQVFFHAQNQGVGGATLTGYQKAFELGADICVKVDGDGQMDPALIPALVDPILRGGADYVKGNRFYYWVDARQMPWVRFIGNMLLSFLAKMSSGYWNLFDPTNGFTALHASLLKVIPLDQLHKRYFFESDLLFHLGLMNAVVLDFPMRAVYGEEKSNLKISKVIPYFVKNHILNFFKRYFYHYYIRGFSIVSLLFPMGWVCLGVGSFFGLSHWIESSRLGVPATPGTVMIAGLLVLVGAQCILNFLQFDVLLTTHKREPLQRSLQFQRGPLA